MEPNFTVRTANIEAEKVRVTEEGFGTFTEALHAMRVITEFSGNTAITIIPGGLVVATSYREDTDTLIRVIGPN